MDLTSDYVAETRDELLLRHAQWLVAAAKMPKEELLDLAYRSYLREQRWLEHEHSLYEQWQWDAFHRRYNRVTAALLGILSVAALGRAMVLVGTAANPTTNADYLWQVIAPFGLGLLTHALLSVTLKPALRRRLALHPTSPASLKEALWRRHTEAAQACQPIQGVDDMV